MITRHLTRHFYVHYNKVKNSFSLSLPPSPLSCCCGVTSIKYQAEHDRQYLSYIELGRWLCSHFQREIPLNFLHADYSKTTQCRVMNLTSLDLLG